MVARTSSAPPKILLVEDDFLIGEALKLMLEEMEIEVVGPVASVEQAQELFDHHDFDGGILDVEIRGGTSAPIARTLERRSCPFFFLTGYGSPLHRLPDELREVHRVVKPAEERLLTNALRSVFGLTLPP